MALAASDPVAVAGSGALSLIVKTSTQIYAGALTAMDPADGRLTNLASGTTLVPVGVANEQVLGDGTLRCLVSTEPNIRMLTVAGVTAVTDVGSPVYASDENTFDLTKATNDYLVGYIVEWISGTTAKVSMFGLQQFLLIEAINKTAT